MVEPVQLRSGVRLHCSIERSCAWLQVERPEGSSKVVVAEWRGGIGGVELVVSPDERFLAVFLYSGQSSQGYELFSLEPVVRVGGLPETLGHGSAPGFSSDGGHLVSLIDVVPRLRATGAFFEDCQDDTSNERAVVDLAQLFVHRLSSPTVVQRFAVGVELAVRRSENETHFELARQLGFRSERTEFIAVTEWPGIDTVDPSNSTMVAAPEKCVPRTHVAVLNDPGVPGFP